MNKAILAVLAATSVQAQGTLSLNTATGAKPRIVCGGVNIVASDNIWMQVLVSGASSLSGPGAEPFPLTLSGANAGLFSKGTLTVNGVPGGSAVDVTLRIWDKDKAPTYEASPDHGLGVYSASVTLSGFVLGGVLDANGIASLPTSIVPAFTGMVLCLPEPGPYALAAIGLITVAIRKLSSIVRV